MIRKLNKLTQYRFKLQHLKGDLNCVADFLSRYLLKRREHSKATQTETSTPEHDCPTQTGDEIVNCNLLKTDNSHIPLDTEELPSIPDDFFSENRIFPSEHKQSSTQLTETDLTTVADRVTCICDSQLPPEDKGLDQEVDQVNLVTSSSNITQQLHLPSLIDLNRIKIAQNEDVILSEVRKWVEKEEKPKDLQKLRLPPELVRYWKKFPLLTVKNDVLCRKWIIHNKDRK
jgi:hypothetical protein